MVIRAGDSSGMHVHLVVELRELLSERLIQGCEDISHFGGGLKGLLFGKPIQGGKSYFSLWCRAEGAAL